MNVLRLTPHFYYLPETGAVWSVRRDPIGGMQTQIYRLSKEMDTQGVCQTILTIGMKGVKKEIKTGENLTIRAANIPIIPIPSRIRGTFGLNFYWGVGVILWLLKYKLISIFKTTKKFDVIHAHCSGVIAPLIIGYLTKLILRKELVYTIHCCRGCTYEPMSSFDAIIHNLAIAIERFCLARAEIIFVLTEKTKQFLKSQYNEMRNKKIVITSDIISYEDFERNVNEHNISNFYSKFNIPQNIKLISYVGRIAHEKGWKYFIQAVQNVEVNVHYLICGDGNEMDELKIMLKRYKLEDKFTLTGYISNEEVAVALKISDILIIPSLHEEFGSLVLEAACMKKALIASSVGGLKRNIENNKTGILIEAKNSLKISESIIKLLDDEKLRIELGNNLYTTIKNKYDVQEVCKTIIHNYKGTISHCGLEC